MSGRLSSVFDDVGSAASRRRPGDLMRVAVAAAVLAGLSVDAHHAVGSVPAVAGFFDSLPGSTATLLEVLCYLLALGAAALLVVALLEVRRWRLLQDLLVSAAATWIAVWLMTLLERARGASPAFAATWRLTDALRFPLALLAVSVAVVAVASPFLDGAARHLGQGLVMVLAVVGLLLGRVFPSDLLGAVVLGWGVAAAVHLAFGTAGGRPGVDQVARALTDLQIQAANLRLAPDQLVGRALLLADDPEGPLKISALGRDEADAQFVARAWRYLAYKHAPPMLFPTRRGQVMSEAYVALLARDHCARVGRVVFSGSVGSLAVLVERVPPGRLFADLDPSEVTDGLLEAMWKQLRALHAARVTHGHLDGHHIVVDAGEPTIVGFEDAVEGVHPDRVARDVAELLATTAAAVGPERAVATAARGVDADVLARALPLLQPRALSGWTHDAFGERDELDTKLERLRVEAAREIGGEPPQLRQLYRVHPRNILMALGVLVAVGTLLSRIGDPAHFWHRIEGADWPLVSIAFVLVLLTDAVFGITFLGNVPIRIPIWPSIELQIAMAFSNLAVPVAADAAIQVRFLQKNGLDLPSAAATGGVLSSVTEIGVQLALFVVALRLSPDSIDVGRVETGRIAALLLIAAFVLGGVVAIVFGVRRIRQAVAPPVLRAARTAWHAVRSPGRLGLLIGGNVVAQLLSATSLLVCVHAFDASVDLWTLIAINIGVTTIASLVPIPGGGTAVSAIGRAGMLAAVGVPRAAAVASVLTHQVVSAYLPAVIGWFAARDLIRKGLL